MHSILHFRSIALAAALGLTGGQAFAGADIMFVLDDSGSMAQKIGSETKMNIAKRAFGNLVSGLPKQARSGLVVYGHRGDKDCSAIETVVPLGSDNGLKMQNAVLGLQPRKGATPLTNALFIGSKTLVEDGEGERTLVLISDGKETCGENPVDFVTKFVDSIPADKMVKFYVIGLDVDAESKAQLEKIATIGGGAYYGAGSEEELSAALNSVAGKVIKTPIFEDDFSGPDINPAWQVLNDDPDTRVLDDGKLNIFTGVGKFPDENVPNLISYNAPITEKNYDITATIVIDATYADYDRYWSYDAISFGIRMAQSPQNDLRLGLALAYTVDYGGNRYAWGYFGKAKSGKWSNSFTNRLLSAKDGVVKFYLRLEKRGYKYTGFISLDNEEWTKMGTIPLLGKNLKPQLYATMPKDFHEIVVSFDDFKILRVEQN